ncbi:hypothetical protein [Kitasatospora griseola]|uniref:hypothetical protein n=1 Tax=Kitasatospora griseola TaxID=2064 RepID=UPI001671482E|nr:hypothetical protein [Kitasatospora griseola]GGR00825.1 hypothetical protein GCM10010195_65820 [Kitasatospora griseola]
METEQRVVQRSGVFSRLLIGVVAASWLLLLHTVIRQNLHGDSLENWPWNIDLFDIQSATAAVLAASGAWLARAQYARAVRPAIGYFARIVDGIGPAGQLVWAVHAFNGAQDMATVTEMDYWVTFTEDARRAGAVDFTDWGTSDEASSAIETRGLVRREDFTLDFIARGRPIPGQGLMFIGWFNEKSLGEVENVFVRLRAIDRVGDTHERTLSLMKGVDRHPQYPDPAPF